MEEHQLTQQSKKDTTVILIHGLFRTKLSMLPLGVFLRRHGYRVLNFGYLSMLGSVAEHSAKLKQFIVKHTAPGEGLNFVTHSLGSIVVRKFASDYHQQFNLGRVVMLGPPNQGSSFAKSIAKLPLAARILGPSFVEMQGFTFATATDLLEVGIIAGGRGDERGYSPLVCGDNDGIVAVSETELEGRKAHLLMPGLHSLLMFYPGVLREVTTFISCGKFNDR
jgi:triacylglycerol esterase/lipase EstA (alpha/beta hydrolase family)